MAHQVGRDVRDRMAFAVVLIVVGAAGLASRVWQPASDVGGWIVLLIGLALAGAFVYTRRYGYLVAGGILTGLGAGIVASESFRFASTEGSGGAVVLGLGLGFLSIWLLASLANIERNHWWPVIPGGILTIVGTALLIGGQAVEALDYWGIGVIAIGLIVLWRALTQDRART
jgi:hypothetical protein